MSKRYYFLLHFFLLFSVSVYLQSCKSGSKKSGIDEGKIEFEITYLDSERENPLIALLPTSMVLKFKNNSTVSNIEGFFGTFKLTYISDSQIGKNSSLLKVLDKKYMYQVDTTQPPFGYEAMRNINIVRTKNTKVVAGYKCQEAKFTCPEISKESMLIYFTDEIDIKNPNSNNPFKEIGGVLLEFQVKLNEINMKFTAKKVISEDVDDTEFEVPKGYTNVDKAEMEKIMESFNNPSKK